MTSNLLRGGCRAPRNIFRGFSKPSQSPGLVSRRSLYTQRPSHLPQSAQARRSIPPQVSRTNYLRHASTGTKTDDKEPSKSSRLVKYAYKAFAFSGFLLVSGTGLILAFFVYDASTYRHDLSHEDIPVSLRALNPRYGGPKNLPIADVLVDDHDSEAKMEQKDKPKLVILGTGWGSVALLKTLNPGDYHVTVVSPENYFLFTPMLPSATVGTLGLRSLVEPIRLIVQRVRGHFLRAEAVDVDFSEKLVEVSQVDCNGKTQSFYLPYDKLIIGVGMKASTIPTVNPIVF